MTQKSNRLESTAPADPVKAGTVSSVRGGSATTQMMFTDRAGAFKRVTEKEQIGREFAAHTAGPSSSKPS